MRSRDRARDMELVDRACLISWWDKVDPKQDDIPTRRLVIDRLEKQIAHMRKLGIEGSWVYSYPLHAQLYEIYQREVAELDALEGRAA